MYKEIKQVIYENGFTHIKYYCSAAVFLPE